MPEAQAVASEPEVLSEAEAQALIDPLPEVNPAAIAAQESREGTATPATTATNATPVAPPPTTPSAGKPAPSKPAPVDEDGTPFNPNIHQTDSKGRPVFRVDGVTLRKRRTIAKEYRDKSRVVLDDEPAPPSAAPVEPELTPEQREMELTASAATLAGLQLMMMKAALGPKLGDEEAQQQELVRAWKRVFQHYGLAELHPVMGLAMVTGGIVVAGLQHKETQSRFEKISHWFQHRMLSLWHWITRRSRPVEVAEEATEAQPKAA